MPIFDYSHLANYTNNQLNKLNSIRHKYIMSKEEEKRLVVESKIDSTSDSRIVNNIMQHEYRILTDKEKVDMKLIKDFGLGFYNAINEISIQLKLIKSDDFEKYEALKIAKMKVEEATMWAVKAITK
jgi:hypothetical protein